MNTLCTIWILMSYRGVVVECCCNLQGLRVWMLLPRQLFLLSAISPSPLVQWCMMGKYAGSFRQSGFPCVFGVSLSVSVLDYGFFPVVCIPNHFPCNRKVSCAGSEIKSLWVYVSVPLSPLALRFFLRFTKSSREFSLNISTILLVISICVSRNPLWNIIPLLDAFLAKIQI